MVATGILEVERGGCVPVTGRLVLHGRTWGVVGEKWLMHRHFSGRANLDASSFGSRFAQGVESLEDSTPVVVREVFLNNIKEYLG